MTETGQYLITMRAAAPLVHCITNYVAMNVMANVLLAAGASPAMVHAREEAAEFAALAQALAVNIGTLDPAWAESMDMAAQVMGDAGRPWVLDPVGVGATRFRQEVCARLLERRPTVIRGNASEILALARLGGAESTGTGSTVTGRGADSADPVEAAQAAADALARRTGSVVAVSGPVDYITDGAQAFHVGNGHPLMPRVTALGCSLNGVIAAFLVGQPALPATIAALAYYGLAGQRAGQVAEGQAQPGPGAFGAAFLDALHALTPADLTQGAQVSRA